MPTLSTPVTIPHSLNPTISFHHQIQTQSSRHTTASQPPSLKIKIRSKAKNEDAFKETKQVRVDYDKGVHDVSLNLSGLKKDDIPRRYRLRVESDKFQKDWDVSQVVNNVLKLNHWEDVDGLLNRWVGRFGRKNFPVLIREITQRGSIEHSNHVFRWMKNQKNYVARTDIYNMMIRLHARHNRTDQARGLFFEMQEWRCKPDVESYNALINVHGRAGQWRWAMNIMEDMLRAAIPPSRSTYNNLINACGSSGNWKEALKVCKTMTDNGVGPDLVTHNIILSAYKNGAQYAKALSYFELMKRTGVHPDATTLNIVIYCLVKLGKYEEAIDIFKSMRGKRAESPPDIVTFTTIIQMYSVCGQIENCKAVFDTMLAEGLKPSLISYNVLLGAYASRGMSEEAFSVFNEIKQKGLRPDVVSYTSLLSAYGRSRQPEKAREIYKMMKNNNLRPNLVSYNALIDAYGANGMLAEAVETLREMEREGVQPDVVSICTLLAASGRCGRKVDIDTILSAANLRGIALNTVAYNAAIGSFLNVGEYDKALSLYKSMGTKRVKPDSVTFNVLISGCCKFGKYDEAIELFNVMVDLAVPISKEVYSSVISAYGQQASAGQLEKLESELANMKMAGCIPDVITYTSIINAYNGAENWEKAIALFNEMETSNVQLDSIGCSAIMRAFIKGGNPANVLVLAKLMRERNISFTDAVFYEMISACSMLRDWKTTIDLVELMEPSFPVISVGLINQLLHILGKSGKSDIMVKFFYKVVASGAQINSFTYSVFLKNLLAVGNWRKYIEVLEWMKDGGPQPTYDMYHDIVTYAERSSGPECAAFIKQRLGSIKQNVLAEEYSQALAPP
ncbi:unnamed protein product [Rhodiola kirilowii]